MIIRTKSWNQIRAQFSDEEKLELGKAVDGQVICPPAASLDETKISEKLLTKLKEALLQVR